MTTRKEAKDFEAAVEGNGAGKREGAAAMSSQTAKRKRTASSKKDNKLEKKIAQLEKEREELKELLLRKAAEFDNFKKRTESEYGRLVANANFELVGDLLPIIDDLERSVASAREAQDFRGLLAGVELITGNFISAFGKRGVAPIRAIGEAFDPEKHEALMQVESDKYPSGIVADEHLKGYIMNGRVLRHSQVLVSK